MSATLAGGLRFEVVVSEGIPLALPDHLPDGGARTWAPLTSTLLIGPSDVVLVDPPLTTLQADRLVTRIRALERRLTHILVTHAHGDHWFTAARIAAQFDGVAVVAAPAVIRAMHRTNDGRGAFWDRILPGQIPPSPVPAIPAPHDRITIAGHEVRIVEMGHTDTGDTTVVHVPHLGLVVAGDVVYDDAHLFLVESGHGGRDSWRAALERLSILRPRHLVAGHATRTTTADPSRLLAETRRYLDDVDELLPRLPDAASFFTAMLERHPDRANPSTLWGSATALYTR